MIYNLTLALLFGVAAVGLLIVGKYGKPVDDTREASSLSTRDIGDRISFITEEGHTINGTLTTIFFKPNWVGIKIFNDADIYWVPTETKIYMRWVKK